LSARQAVAGNQRGQRFSLGFFNDLGTPYLGVSFLFLLNGSVSMATREEASPLT